MTVAQKFFIIVGIVSMHLYANAQSSRKETQFTIAPKGKQTVVIKPGELHVYKFEVPIHNSALFITSELGNEGANIKVGIDTPSVQLREHINCWGVQSLYVNGLDTNPRHHLFISWDDEDGTNKKTEGKYLIYFKHIEPTSKKSIYDFLAAFNYSYLITLSKYSHRDSVRKSVEELFQTSSIAQDSTTKANILGLLGKKIAHVGGYSWEADSILQKALIYYRNLNNEYGVGKTLYDIADNFYQRGDKAKNIDFGNQALTVFTKLKCDADIGLTCNDLGLSYSILGTQAEANYYYEEARKHVKDKKSWLYGTIVHNIGLQFLGEKQYDSSIHYLTIAAELRQDKYSKRGRAQSLSNLSIALAEKGRYKQAVKATVEAIQISDQEKDLDNAIIDQARLGELYYYYLNDKPKGIKIWNEAISMGKGSKALPVVHHQLAHIAISDGRWADALPHIRYLEYERIQLESINRPSHKAREYGEGRLEHLYMKVRCFMELHKIDPTKHYSDSAAYATGFAKGKNFVAESRFPPTVKFKVLRDEYLRIISDSIWSATAIDDDPSLKDLRVSRLLNEYQYRRSGYGSEVNIESVPNVNIPENSIDFLLSEPESYGWVKTEGKIVPFYLPPTSFFDSVVNKVSSMTEIFFSSDNPTQREKITSMIYDQLELISGPLRPMLNTLKKGRVYVIRDGPLAKIPFQLLDLDASKSEYSPAVLDFEFSNLPSFRFYTRTGSSSDINTSDKMLVIFDPVYDVTDNRLLNTANRSMPSKYPRLSGSVSEAQKVIRFYPDNHMISGFDALKNNIISLPWYTYDYIHVAVHGNYDLTYPDLSSMVLSQFDGAGNVKSNSLFSFEIQDLNAKLVVLSSCHSGAGKPFTTEGILSLERSFLVAGAKAIVSANWSVPDKFSEDFFSTFYQYHRRLKMSAAGALKQTQKDFLKTKFSSPLYWGAFTYTGVN